MRRTTDVFPTTVDLRADADVLTGQTFGALKVERLLGRRIYPSGQTKLVYAVFCTRCGKSSRAPRSAILRLPEHCGHCLRTIGAADQSVRLSDGRTLVDVARLSGVSLDTVYKRWRRGWPEKLLAKPRRARGEAQRSEPFGSSGTVRPPRT